MKIAMCQLQIVWEDKKQTFEKCLNYLREAAEQNADIILFPEMSLTGFSMDIEKTKEQEPETVELFAQHAREYKIAIGFGWVSAKDGKAQNHYTIVDDSGAVIGDYIKLHPFSYGGENQYFIAGEKLCICRYKGVNIGISICYDLRFPELYQLLSKKAELIIVPANWPGSRREHWRCLLQARAIENQVYIAGINCVGEIGGMEYSGDSEAIHPGGTILGECSSREGLLVFEMDDDVKRCRESFPVKKDRRETLYRALGEK